MKFLVLFLLLSSQFSFARIVPKKQGLSLAEQEVLIDFLISQKSTTEVLLEINKLNLQIYLQCTENPTGHAQITVMNDSFQKEVRERSCERILGFLFFKKIKKDFSEMKIALSLSRPKLFSVNKKKMSMSQNIDYKLNSMPKHPKIEISFFKNLETSIIDPLTREEEEIALATYKEHQRQACESFKKVQIDNYLSFLKNQEQIHAFKKDFCNLDLEKYIDGLSNYTQKQLFKSFTHNYHRFLEIERGSLREEQLNRYKTYISRYPILLFLQNDSPTHTELYEVFKKIEPFQEDFSNQFYQYALDNHIDNKIKNFKDRTMSSSTYNDFIEELSFYYKKEIVNAYQYHWTKDKEETYNIIEQYKHQVETDIQLKNDISSMARLGATIASCFAPLGKVKVLANYKKAFSSTCFMALSLPLELYFLSLSYGTSNEVLNGMFQSPEGQFTMSSYSDLDKYQKELMISKVFALFGVGSIPKSFKEIKKIHRMFKIHN